MTEPITVPALGNTPAAPMNPRDARSDEFADYPRDQWDRPLIAVLDEAGRPRPNPITGMTDRYGTPIPWVSEPHIRASTAGSAVEHEGAINSWRIRQAVIGFMMRPDLFALACAVDDPGAEGRSELDKQVKAAQEVAGSSAAANSGTAAHAFAEKLDRGQTIPPLDPVLTGWLEAYAKLTAGWIWHEVEARLVCPALRMAGRTDRIGSPAGWMIAPDGQIIGPGDRVVVDLKTSSSSRYFGVKFAVQLAVYAFGDLYDPATGEFTPTGARRDWALVLHIPSGATSGSWWWVNVAAGYELAGLANEVLGARKRKDVVAQVAQVYATLDEALAAGGVLLDENYVGGNAPVVDFTPADVVPRAEMYPGGPIVRVKDEPGPMLTPEAVAALHEVPVDMVKAANPSMGAPVADEAVAEILAAGEGPASVGPAANRTTVPDSVTAGIPADLGPSLQAGAQLARELTAVATAPPRGGLEAVRQRYADSWTAEHEAAAQRRGWELGVLAALERQPDVTGLLSVFNQVAQYPGAWTAEMDRVADRCAAEMTKGD